MNDCEESNNKSAYDTCVAFNPNAAGLLRYDKKNAQCILGGEQGLELKDQSNQVCEVKYNVKIEMEVNDSSTLYLYFSKNGGESFYNSDEPRVATKDEAKRRRLQSECSTCAQSMCKGIDELCVAGTPWRSEFECNDHILYFTTKYCMQSELELGLGFGQTLCKGIDELCGDAFVSWDWWGTDPWFTPPWRSELECNAYILDFTTKWCVECCVME